MRVWAWCAETVSHGASQQVLPNSSSQLTVFPNTYSVPDRMEMMGNFFFKVLDFIFKIRFMFLIMRMFVCLSVYAPMEVRKEGFRVPGAGVAGG